MHAGEIGLGEEAGQGSVEDATTAATTGLWVNLSSDAASGDGVYLALCDVEGTSGLFFLVPKILAVAEWSTLTFPVAKRHAASFSSMEAIPLTVFQGDSIKEQDRPQKFPQRLSDVFHQTQSSCGRQKTFFVKMLLGLQHRWVTGSHRLLFVLGLVLCFVAEAEARSSRRGGKKNKKKRAIPKANPLGEDGQPRPPVEKEWYEERVRFILLCQRTMLDIIIE